MGNYYNISGYPVKYPVKMVRNVSRLAITKYDMCVRELDWLSVRLTKSSIKPRRNQVEYQMRECNHTHYQRRCSLFAGVCEGHINGNMNSRELGFNVILASWQSRYQGSCPVLCPTAHFPPKRGGMSFSMMENCSLSSQEEK